MLNRSHVRFDARLAVIEIGAGTPIKIVRHQTSTNMDFPNSTLIRINRDDSQAGLPKDTIVVRKLTYFWILASDIALVAPHFY